MVVNRAFSVRFGSYEGRLSSNRNFRSGHLGDGRHIRRELRKIKIAKSLS
jgi:hypothetical protein